LLSGVSDTSRTSFSVIKCVVIKSPYNNKASVTQFPDTVIILGDTVKLVVDSVALLYVMSVTNTTGRETDRGRERERDLPHTSPITDRTPFVIRQSQSYSWCNIVGLCPKKFHFFPCGPAALLFLEVSSSHTATHRHTTVDQSIGFLCSRSHTVTHRSR
jgi:hypothetical protein